MNLSKLFAWLFMKTANIKDNEILACSLSFLIVFLLMGSYYILRPVRDAMASDWSDAEVSFLWTVNFFFSAAIVTFYGWAVSRIKFTWLVPSVYAFFAMSFSLFFTFIVLSDRHVLIDKTFYVWVSVYSLFNISVFWSFMSDLYNKDQASRLFAIIGAGASAGALAGPAIPTLFSAWIGANQLLLISALCLLIVIPIILKLQTLKESRLGNIQETSERTHDRIGGNPFTGFRDFIQNPYLLAIGFFIILYTSIATVVYFQQKNLLESYSLDQRTQILGAVDWIVNLLTFLIAFFATGRIVKKLGMPFALSCVPFILSGGLLISAYSPILIVTLLLQIVRRAGNYAITRPAREMLFTQVTREERFKAKPVIDIVAYRGGDMVTSWGIASLTQGLGFGMGALAAIGAGIAALWTCVSIYLGKIFEHETNNR